jgi:hypothetical protein
MTLYEYSLSLQKKRTEIINSIDRSKPTISQGHHYDQMYLEFLDDLRKEFNSRVNENTSSEGR